MDPNELTVALREGFWMQWGEDGEVIISPTASKPSSDGKSYRPVIFNDMSSFTDMLDAGYAPRRDSTEGAA